MANNKDKIRTDLHRMLTNAEIDFDMLVAMREARSNPDLHNLLNLKYGRFYGSAANAFFNSIIIILYKVFEKREDTSNFWELKKTLPSKIDKEKSSVIEDKYKEAFSIWKKVCLLRNNVIGHHNANRPIEEFYDKADISMNDLKRMIQLCQELLCFIATNFHDVHVVFNIKGAESFELLIEDLKSIKSIS